LFKNERIVFEVEMVLMSSKQIRVIVVIVGHPREVLPLSVVVSRLILVQQRADA